MTGNTETQKMCLLRLAFLGTELGRRLLEEEGSGSKIITSTFTAKYGIDFRLHGILD